MSYHNILMPEVIYWQYQGLWWLSAPQREFFGRPWAFQTTFCTGKASQLTRMRKFVSQMRSGYGISPLRHISLQYWGLRWLTASKQDFSGPTWRVSGHVGQPWELKRTSKVPSSVPSCGYHMYFVSQGHILGYWGISRSSKSKNLCFWAIFEGWGHFDSE